MTWFCSCITVPVTPAHRYPGAALPPPPPRRSSTGLVVVLVVVASLSLVVAAAAFTLAWRSSRRSAGVPVVGSANASSGASAVDAPVEREAAAAAAPVPTPDEGAPSSPGSPPSSLRARPPWASDELSGHGKPTLEYAPQPSNPLALFLAAAPLSADVDRAFLICRAQTFAHHDLLAGDDLHVRAIFGKTPEVANDGQEDANLGFVSAPVATLKRGESLRMEIFDRDVFGMTRIASEQMRFQRGPLVILGQGASVECRVLDGASLVAIAAARAAAADVGVRELGRRELDPNAVGWGWPTVDLETARELVADVAGLVGWDDARARNRVVAVDAAVLALDRRKADVFQKLYAVARDDVDGAGVRARVTHFACAGGACTASVHLDNRRDTPLALGELADASLYLATEATGPIDATIEGSSSRVEIAAKGSADIVVQATLRDADLGHRGRRGLGYYRLPSTPPPASAAASLAAGPAILGICTGTRAQEACVAARAR